MNRRQLVAASVAACGASLPLAGCLRFHFVTASAVGRKLMVDRAELGASRFALVDPPGGHLPIFLYRLDDGGWSAVSTRCMHRGCPVEPVSDRLVCPCHGSEYTSTGEVLKGPTERPLRPFPASVDGDRIVIELPAEGESW